MQLRPYQKECIEILNSLPEGARVVVCLATGLGKTVVGANIDFSGRMLWISHRDELVRQPEKYFKERGFSYGIEKADEHSNGEKVVSASIQTLCKTDRLQSFDPDDFEIIICDEAQHAAAASYRRVLDYFHPKKLIGLTATPKRGDKVRLTDVFDTICYTRDLRWGIENKYLSRIRCLKVQADYDMNTVSKSMGDYTAVSLDKQMSASNDDLVVAKAYIEHCLPTHRQTLIYCPSIRICYTVYYAMMAALPKEESGTVAVLTDKVSPEERAQILNDYSRIKIHCIINCMILTEGTDLPETSCIINNRPSANASLYVQIIGRGTRPADGKDYCLVIDIVGKNYEFKDICTAPTLFGIDPDLLPEKVRKQMEEEDLLEFSNAVLRSKDSVLGTRLIQEMVDIFTQERIAIVTENAREGYRKIAGEYE